MTAHGNRDPGAPRHVAVTRRAMGFRVKNAPLQAARIFDDIAGPAHRTRWHSVPHGK